jgi:hypothetical protein
MRGRMRQMARRRRPRMPSDVSGLVSAFDRFAERSAGISSRAPFFAICLLLVVIWAPTVMFLSFDTWQLLINTVTTIITFLLVALLQNSQTRADQATQHKLNAIADGLADLMEHLAGDSEGLRKEIRELKLAVGLEERESTAGDDRLGPRRAS